MKKRRDLFSRTKKNIILICLCIVIGCLLVFAIMTDLIYRSRLFSTVDQQIQTEKNMILRDPSIIKKKGNGKEIILPAPLTTDLISFVWEGNTLADSSPHEYKGTKKYPSFPSHEDSHIITLQDGDYTYRAVQFEKQGLTVQLLINVDDELLSLKALERALSLAFILLLVISFLLARVLAQLVLKPIHRSYDKQVAFVQDASHEMRTPLTVIQGRLELLIKHHQETIDDHLDELAGIMSEVRGLENLNRDLLLMSKEDLNSQATLSVSSTSLRTFLDDICSFYSDYADLQEKVFTFDFPQEDLLVNWDLVKTKRCLSIVLDNAFKYTHLEDTIYLKALKHIKSIQIQIIDTGIGIKEDDLSRIFDRFFRSSEVRATGISGSGIGLSLLQSLAHTLNIKIQVQSTYGEGTTFTLDIPINMNS